MSDLLTSPARTDADSVRTSVLLRLHLESFEVRFVLVRGVAVSEGRIFFPLTHLFQLVTLLCTILALAPPRVITSLRRVSNFPMAGLTLCFLG